MGAVSELDVVFYSAPENGAFYMLGKGRVFMDAKAVWNFLQVVFCAVGSGIAWFLGGWDGLLYALVAFTAIDYGTGMLCAVFEKKLSSEVGMRGIIKKVLIFLLVGVAHTVDSQLVGNGGIVRTAVILFFLSNEGLSLLENSCRLGLPIPPKLKEILSQLHHGKKKGD